MMGNPYEPVAGPAWDNCGPRISGPWLCAG